MTMLTRHHILILIIMAAGAGLIPPPSHAQALSIGIMDDPSVLIAGPRVSSAHSLERALVDITAVDAETVRPKDGRLVSGRAQRTGQGIVLDPSGIIVTNKHIIDNAEHIYVKLSSGKILEAKVIRQGTTDFSFIKVDAPSSLKAIALGDSSQAKIGNTVLAFANAQLNKERKLSGQIIQLFREVSSNRVEILEVNIPLKPGDSGGPILSEDGELLGLIMANQKSDHNKSYAIASNQIEQEFLQYKNSTIN